MFFVVFHAGDDFGIGSCLFVRERRRGGIFGRQGKQGDEVVL
jgi:hypothetical protein